MNSCFIFFSDFVHPTVSQTFYTFTLNTPPENTLKSNNTFQIRVKHVPIIFSINKFIDSVGFMKTASYPLIHTFRADVQRSRDDGIIVQPTRCDKCFELVASRNASMLTHYDKQTPRGIDFRRNFIRTTVGHCNFFLRFGLSAG